MKLKSQRKDGRGNIHSGSLSREMLDILPRILKNFLNKMEKLGESIFEVEEFVKFVKNHFPDIEPFVSCEKRSDVRKRAPGRSIIDLQDACYHLSGPESFWIIDEDSNEKIIIFKRVGKMQYRILRNWQKYFFGGA